MLSNYSLPKTPRERRGQIKRKTRAHRKYIYKKRNSRPFILEIPIEMVILIFLHAGTTILSIIRTCKYFNKFIEMDMPNCHSDEIIWHILTENMINLEHILDCNLTHDEHIIRPPKI